MSGKNDTLILQKHVQLECWLVPGTNEMGAVLENVVSGLAATCVSTLVKCSVMSKPSYTVNIETEATTS